MSETVLIVQTFSPLEIASNLAVRDAYQAGKVAAANGIGADDYPRRPGTKPHRAWLIGRKQQLIGMAVIAELGLIVEQARRA